MPLVGHYNSVLHKFSALVSHKTTGQRHTERAQISHTGQVEIQSTPAKKTQCKRSHRPVQCCISNMDSWHQLINGYKHFREPCCLHLQHLCSRISMEKLTWNVSIYSPIHNASYPWKFKSLSTPLCEPQTSHTSSIFQLTTHSVVIYITGKGALCFAKHHNRHEEQASEAITLVFHNP